MHKLNWNPHTKRKSSGSSVISLSFHTKCADEGEKGSKSIAYVMIAESSKLFLMGGEEKPLCTLCSQVNGGNYDVDGSLIVQVLTSLMTSIMVNTE